MKRPHAVTLWPIVKAFSEGKTVQYMRVSGKWEDAIEPSFVPDLTWRVKPDSPREFWIFPIDVGEYRGYADREDTADYRGVIHVREVTEDDSL